MILLTSAPHDRLVDEDALHMPSEGDNPLALSSSGTSRRLRPPHASSPRRPAVDGALAAVRRLGRVA